MAETSTRPNRSRRAAGTAKADAPAKATPAKATKAAAKTAPATDENRTKVPVILEYAGDTKSYAVFVPPKSSGCVGKFYAPLGTEEVKLLLIGPASE